jgi:RimJ/RimL family protein N-acetyltransferase
MTWEKPDIINLASERVAFGPLREDLVSVYSAWRNDFWMQRTWGNPIRPRTLEQQQAALQNAMDDDDTVRFTIYRHDTWQPIGLINLQNLDLEHQSAELGIGIGAADLRGKGYGTEACRLMLFYAFRLLNLHSVYLTYDGANPGARAYANAGFKPVGVYREAVLVDAKRYDLIHMDCLASEFAPPAVLHWGAPPEE